MSKREGGKVGHYRLMGLKLKECRKSIKKGVISHLENHNLIEQSQHGTMNGKFCLTNLLQVFMEVSTRQRGEPKDILCLDF